MKGTSTSAATTASFLSNTELKESVKKYHQAVFDALIKSSSAATNRQFLTQLLLNLATIDYDSSQSSYADVLKIRLKTGTFDTKVITLFLLFRMLDASNAVKLLESLDCLNQEIIPSLQEALKTLQTYLPEATYAQILQPIKLCQLYPMIREYYEQKETKSEKITDDYKKTVDAICLNMIGQRHAIDRSCRLLATHMGKKKGKSAAAARPMNFMFVGPSGIGKTQLAKEIARVNYASLIELLSMEKYNLEQQATIFTGASPTYIGSDKPPHLAELFNKHLTGEKTPEGCKIVKPSVWVLDEFEKAHRTIKQLFLGILSEGRYSYKNSVESMEYSVENCVFIATSNLLANEVKTMFNAQEPIEKIEAKFMSLNASIQFVPESFPPELLSRFGVIPFGPLNREEYSKMVSFSLNEEFSEAKNELELKDIGFRDAQDKQRITALITENFYQLTGGADVRKLKLKIREAIRGNLCSSPHNLTGLKVIICENRETGQLIAETFRYSPALLDYTCKYSIHLSPNLMGDKIRAIPETYTSLT